MPVYQPGDTLLNEYRIEALLGSGSFGEVYLVTNLGLNVRRAVKVLRKDMAGLSTAEFDSGRKRFWLEAQLGAMLNTPITNPYLLQVHRFENREGVLLLEMEYASGGSLLEKLNGYRAQGEGMPVTEALQVTWEVAMGLAALHRADIVHRDVKPANILFDSHAHARLADFGIAQTMDDFTLRTQLGSLAQPHPGTGPYMSPEQDSTRAALQPPSDIYSLGVVLFEMLTKRNYALQPPGTRPSTLRADLSPLVDDLLSEMLNPVPGKRPWNGAVTAGLITEILQGPSGVTAHPVPQFATYSSAPALPAAGGGTYDSMGVPVWPQTGYTPVRKSFWIKYAPYLLGIMILCLAATGFLGLAVWWGSQRIATSTRAVNSPTQQLKSLPAAATLSPQPTVPTLSEVVPNPKLGSSVARSKDGMIMVYVPSGSFQMGSVNGAPDERPVHLVNLDAFWIDRTDVTKAMFARFVADQGYKTDAEKIGKSFVYDPTQGNWAPSSGADWQHPQGPGNDLTGLDDHPVVQVSWNDAQAYCAWAGARLPTEAEWEKTARGIDNRIYPWGNQPPDGSLANFADASLVGAKWADKNINDGYEFTSPVGHYPQNISPYGAMDMAGNAWQWTQDWYSDSYYNNSPSSNPTGPAAGAHRVLRGGSWYYSAEYLRSSTRLNDDPTVAVGLYGFRCAYN